MIPYNGSLTEDDYVEVARLRRKIAPAPRSLASLVGRLGVAFVALGVWAFVVDPKNLSGAGSWAILALPCFVFAWFRRYDPRREWQAIPELREPYTGHVTGEALESRIAGTDSRVPWQGVVGYAASPTAMVLGLGRLDIPLVRGFFATEEDWQSARMIIQKNVPVSAAPSTPRSKLILLWLSVLVVLFLAWHFARSEVRPRHDSSQTEK